MTIPDVVAEAPVEEAQRLRMTYEGFLAWPDEDVHACSASGCASVGCGLKGYRTLH
ncbi:MAG: hypothetical protein MAG451_02766 [Anaerolineales bacterium]|nr:hypothetical protein [Anaerolineales bacterium]